ncbi:MAG: DUF6516 family protein [Nitrospirota bacterium]
MSVIDEYISKVRKELENKSSIIKQIQIDLDTPIAIRQGILKGRIIFLDDSILYLNEIISDKVKRYRFHYMNHNNDLIMRWDSSPHHKELPTFPYHLHTSDRIISSQPVTLIDVLKCVEDVVLGSLKDRT